MAHIVISGVSFTPAAIGIQHVAIHYKLASDPDVGGSYTLVDSDVSVNPDGTFVDGPITINGLTDGLEYTIKITQSCGSNDTFLEDIIAGEAGVFAQYLMSVDGSVSITGSSIGGGVLSPTPLVADETANGYSVATEDGDYTFTITIDLDVVANYTVTIVVDGTTVFTESSSGDDIISAVGITLNTTSFVYIRVVED